MLGYAHLEHNAFLFITVTTVTPVMSVFFCGFIVFDLIKNCNACNLLQSYCFRFYFRLVTVIIFWTMVRLQRHTWQKTRANIEDPVVHLERNLSEHPVAGLLWERQFEEVLLELGWEKVPSWECMFVHRKQRLFLSVFVNDIK